MRDAIVSLVPRELLREKAGAERMLSDQGEVLSESVSWSPGEGHRQAQKQAFHFVLQPSTNPDHGGN